MDYQKEYRSFLSSYHLADGFRMTLAVLLPALFLGYYGYLEAGLAISISALCVSLADLPGPIHHRRNGMLASSFFVVLAALLTAITAPHPWLFGPSLVLLCFFFSYIGIYGARATSIGVASILVIVLESEHRYRGMALIIHLAWLLLGAGWYTLLSLLLYRIRPYRLLQQALGEFVLATGDYLRVRAAFYETRVDFAANYDKLLLSQSSVQEKQELAAELIFKTRSMVKESTPLSRSLMMLYLETADLLERIMTTHVDYKQLHQYFEKAGILNQYHLLLLSMARELDEVGLAIKSGRPSEYNAHIDEELLRKREEFRELHRHFVAPGNLGGFISLRHILDNMEHIAGRIRALHQYASMKEIPPGLENSIPDPGVYIQRQDWSPGLLVTNLSLRSNLFRHALRISLAALLAWLVGLFLPVGHSYWILLTVIVILKPAYGLTRKRNVQRLGGTLLGAALGAVLLTVLRDSRLILLLLALSMLGAYSFMRRQYFVSVVMITLYVLTLFRLLDPRDFSLILRDRVLDTAAGSVLALLVSYFPPPVWTRQQITGLMIRCLTDLAEYLEIAASPFSGSTPPMEKETKLLRKNSWLSLANFSDAFNRMLSEPKSRQQQAVYIHRLLVTCHLLNAHLSTLAIYSRQPRPGVIAKEYEAVKRLCRQHLLSSASAMAGEFSKEEEDLLSSGRKALGLLDEKLDSLLRKRSVELADGRLETETRQELSEYKSILDQFHFLYRLTEEIHHLAQRLKEPEKL